MRPNARRNVLFDRAAITLLELVVVISILSLLLAIAFPAIVSVREGGRRSQCVDQLRRIGVAIHGFHQSYHSLPTGRAGSHPSNSFLYRILPWMEQHQVYQKGNPVNPATENHAVGIESIANYLCPSDPLARRPREFDEVAASSYVGNLGTGYHNGENGIFSLFQLRRLGFEDIPDGISHTAMVSEALTGSGDSDRRRLIFDIPTRLSPEEFAATCRLMGQEFATEHPQSWTRGRPWNDASYLFTGYHHWLEPNQTNCLHHTSVFDGVFSASSQHFGGVNVLFVDGSVHFMQNDIELSIWAAIGSRNGSEVVQLP